MSPFDFTIIAATIVFSLVFIWLRVTREKLEPSPLDSAETFQQQLKSGRFTIVQFYADF